MEDITCSGPPTIHSAKALAEQFERHEKIRAARLVNDEIRQKHSRHQSETEQVRYRETRKLSIIAIWLAAASTILAALAVLK